MKKKDKDKEFTDFYKERQSSIYCMEVLTALQQPESGEYKKATISTNNGLHTYGFVLIKPPFDYKKYLPTEEDIRTTCAVLMFVIQLFIVSKLYHLF